MATTTSQENRQRDRDDQFYQVQQDVAILKERTELLVKTSESTAIDVRTIRDARYISAPELTILLEKMQGSFATKGDLALLQAGDADKEKRIAALEGQRNWLVLLILSFVILGVLGATVFFNSPLKPS